MSNATYTLECAGFTRDGLPNVAAVQQALDALKARYSLKGEEVRVYRFINGSRIGKADLVGKVS